MAPGPLESVTKCCCIMPLASNAHHANDPDVKTIRASKRNDTVQFLQIHGIVAELTFAQVYGVGFFSKLPLVNLDKCYREDLQAREMSAARGSLHPLDFPARCMPLYLPPLLRLCLPPLLRQHIWAKQQS